MTVDFAMYECHFSDLSSAIEFAEQVMREDLLIASFWKQNEWTGSATVGQNEQITMPDSFDKNSDLLKVRSWTGHLDCEHAI